MTQQAEIEIPAEAPVEALEQAACMHYWVIKPADGPVSQGACQTCGTIREFKNYVESAAWGDARLSNRTDVEGTPLVSAPSAESNSDDEDED